MTLKNSFLTDVCENIKRRNWVFWLSFLTFFCYFPGYLVLALNNLRSSYVGRDASSILRMQERMLNMVEANLGLNGFPNSKILRDRISEYLNIGMPNAKTFLKRLNLIQISLEELKELCQKLEM